MPDDAPSSRRFADVADRLSMPLVEAMETQRAVRRVLPDPVDDAIVLRCIELALKAPTGSNGQNWEFVVVKDRAVEDSWVPSTGGHGRSMAAQAAEWPSVVRTTGRWSAS